MADIRYVITVDSTGATKSVQTFEQALKETGETTQKTEKKAESLWKQFAIGQIVVRALSSAFRDMKKFITDSIAAANEQEDANNALRASLELTGRTIAGNYEHYTQYAAALQKVTTYGDEQIQSVQNLLVQMTKLDQQGIDKATRGALGLASTLKIDLNSAALLVQKAVEGNIGALSRYGIKVDESLGPAEKQAALLDKLEKLYGRSTAEVNTFSGQMKQLTNIWGDAKEEIGGAITKNEKVLGSFQDIKTLIVLMMPDIRDFIGSLATFVADLAGAATDAIGWINKVKGSVGGSRSEVSEADQAWDSLSKKMGGFSGVAEQVVAQLNRVQQYSKDNTSVATALWESFNTIGERATLAAIAAGKFGKDTAAALAVAGGESLKVALALQVAKGAVIEAGNAAKPAEKTMGEYTLQLWEVSRAHRALMPLAEKTTSTIVDSSPPLAAATANWRLIQKELDRINKTPPTWTEKWISAMETLQQASNQVFASFDAVFAQSQTNKEIALDNEYKMRLDYINRTITDETAKQQAITALEAEYEIKRSASRRAGAKAAKAVAFMEAIVNTASGVSRALKDFPFPLSAIIAGIVGALGAVQVALIAKQPIPLAKGFEGIVRKPTTFLAGEAGPEYLSVRPMGQAGGGGLSVTINGPMVATSAALTQEMCQRAASWMFTAIESEAQRRGRRLAWQK